MSTPTEFLVHSVRSILNNNGSNNNVNTDLDIELPCSTCHFEVKHNDKSIQCTSCKLWAHIKCNGITVDEYVERQKRNRDNPELEDSELWTCMACILYDRSKFVPFINSSNSELNNLNSIDSMKLFELLPNEDVKFDAQLFNQVSNDELD